MGKTSAARELARLLPSSRIVDPERLGRLLERTPRRVCPGDYQHLPAWRRGTVLRPIDALTARIDGDLDDPSAASWRRCHIAAYQEARSDLAAAGSTMTTVDDSPAQIAQRIADLL